LGFPFATFGRAYHASPFPWVDVDGASGTSQVVEHLKELGHRRIGLVAWPAGSESGDTRVKGFFDGMTAAGLEVYSELVVRTENGFEKGRVAGTSMLSSADPPTAIVTVQDELGFGIMTAATELGLRPGRDLAVSGFDDTAAAASMWPGLTSVRQPLDEVAGALVDLMVHRLSSPGEPPRTALLHPQLVVRDSTLGTRR
jgi:LacI family transcriptional regulator